MFTAIGGRRGSSKFSSKEINPISVELVTFDMDISKNYSDGVCGYTSG